MSNTTTHKVRPNYAPGVPNAVRIVLDHQGDYPSRSTAARSVAIVGAGQEGFNFEDRDHRDGREKRREEFLD